MRRRQSAHGLLSGFVSLLFVLGMPSISTAQYFGVPSITTGQITPPEPGTIQFHPYITVGEEYNNNVFLSNRNKIDDFITNADLGLTFSTAQKNYGIDLIASAGLVYYAKHSDLSYFNPSGLLNGWYAVAPNLTFRARDYFTRSDEARESIYSANAQPNQYLLATQRGVQAIYIRNVVEPSLEYAFAKDGLFSVLYRNNFYHNDNHFFEDSQENTVNPKLTYWFDIKNGITLDYYLTFAQFDRSPDFVSNGIRTRYTYRFDPRISSFIEYFYQKLDYKSPGIDYDVHNPSLGVEYKFSPTLTGIAQVGYYWQIPVKGGESSGPSFNLSLAKTGQRTTYTVAFQGGYTEDYFTSQNRGFTKYYRAYGTISHQLMEKLTVGLTGSVERAIYSNDQKDWIWGIWGTASYQLLRWLSLSLRVGYVQDNSNINNLDYTQFRTILSLNATL